MRMRPERGLPCEAEAEERVSRGAMAAGGLSRSERKAAERVRRLREEQQRERLRQVRRRRSPVRLCQARAAAHRPPARRCRAS